MSTFVRTKSEQPPRRLFHNYPTDWLQREAEELETVFDSVELSPEQARVNRRIFAAISEELAERFVKEAQKMEVIPV